MEQMRQLKHREAQGTQLTSDRTGTRTQSGSSLCSQPPHYPEFTVFLLHSVDRAPYPPLYPPVYLRRYFFIFSRKLFNIAFRYNSQFIGNKEDRERCERIPWVSNQQNPDCSKLSRINNSVFSMTRWQRDSDWFWTYRLRDLKDLQPLSMCGHYLEPDLKTN